MTSAQNESRQRVTSTASCLSGEDRTRTSAGNTGNTGVSVQSGAESGALGGDFAPIDPDLALILERWPALPEAARASIMAVVREAAN